MEQALVAGLSNGKHFAHGLLASKGFHELGYEHRIFPDGENYGRFLGSCRGKKVVLTQSLFPHPNDALIELFLAAKNARSLGAKKVTAVIPYLGYMRQDKVFHSGESFSAKFVAQFLSSFLDEVLTFDAHLHRIKKMNDIFSVPAMNLSSAPAIAQFIGKKFSAHNTVVVGPDEESSQWANKIAQMIGFESAVLKKHRLSDRRVKVVADKKFDFAGKKIVIVDDIASTGKTIISAASELKKRKASEIHVICVHAILVEGAEQKIKNAGAKNIYSCNTIEHKTNRINVSGVAAEKLEVK